MRTISRKFRIDAGHRILNHEGKCKNLHGHSYEFTFTFTAPELDPLGRVIDFGELKKVIGDWLDLWWDHGMILHQEDPVVNLYKPGGMLSGDKAYFLPYNPTAENLSSYLFDYFAPNAYLVKKRIQLVSVRCQETPNCSADVTIGD